MYMYKIYYIAIDSDELSFFLTSDTVFFLIVSNVIKD